ncbi:hypothetical protein DYB38_001919 [Aphanomyces astaci]|uniref:U6 small nuclear RNA (adenine-(43)-N(6))-methyltransferase n=1 Tax=Aphanomyces astaci TaxID=112090 RepID=A0A397DG82_APHAT|nr:hypothetical protein DYB38_001919 [Aphanomyces astaci]
MRGEKRKRTDVNNDGIHPRNMYRNPPDFKALAKAYPSELTRALLHRDFGITTWHVPLNRLCPPLPNRLNYIHWIEDLILFSQSSYVSTEDAPIWGVDIGTGASVIYPLLGHSLNQWRFLATDVDAESIEYAAANLRSNHLEHVIHLETVADGHDAAILPTASIQRRCRHDGPVLFTMCNPPFFDSIDQADTNPRTACTGSASEMTTPGGEVAFVTRMIQDSLLLTSQVRWYTSLIGRKSSLRPLLAILRSHGIPNMRTTEFLQGRTTRWGLAWSFTTDGSTTPNEVLSFDTLSQKKSYDTVLHGHKVLAKRREAKRRQALTFHLPQSFPAVSTGHCASMDDVHRRILDSAALLESAEMGIAIREEHVGDDGSLSTPCRTYELVATTTNEQGLRRTVLFHALARAQVSTDDKHAMGFDMSLEWRHGVARDRFWTFSDKWKAAILRTGRRWRKQASCESK